MAAKLPSDPCSIAQHHSRNGAIDIAAKLRRLAELRSLRTQLFIQEGKLLNEINQALDRIETATKDCGKK